CVMANILHSRKISLYVHISRFVIFFWVLTAWAFCWRLGCGMGVTTKRASPFYWLFTCKNSATLNHLKQSFVSLTVLRFNFANLRKKHGRFQVPLCLCFVGESGIHSDSFIVHAVNC